MSASKTFIIQTAKDYDIPVHIVEKLYEKYGATKQLYKKLEEFTTKNHPQK